MPQVLPPRRAPDALRIFRSPAVLASLVCAVVLVGAVFWYQHRRPPAAAPVSTGITSKLSPAPTAPACSAPNQSFCSDQVIFTKYVSEGDFSDVLERQTPTRVTCGPSTASLAACAGATGGLPIETFTINTSGTPSLLTRNQYIDYFQTYVRQYGPFAFASDTATTGTITMAFAGARGSKTISLSFQPAGGSWKLQSLAVN